jgi:hypothetical protein
MSDLNVLLGGGLMRGGTMQIEVVRETDDELRARRDRALARIDVSADELRQRVIDHEASYDEREVWSIVDEVNYLLGEDG